MSIPTDAMLAFFFASEKSATIGTKMVDLEILQKFAYYLSNNLPGYIFFNISPEAIKRTIEETSIKVRERGSGREVVSYIYYRLENNHIIYNDNKYSVNINYYLEMYPEVWKNRIVRIINNFFELRIYEINVVLLSPILA